jgi:heme exporter protein D
MSNYDKIAWLPLCAGLTGLGLVLSYLVMRRRGLGSGLRGAAFSLLPLAAYLTGAVKMLWKMGVAIGDFAAGFVFSTRVWSGIAVTALAVLLFVVSGPLRRRSVTKGRASRDRDTRAVEAADQGRTAARAPSGGQLATRPAPAPSPAPAHEGKPKDADDDDDLADVADILRRHGIT